MIDLREQLRSIFGLDDFRPMQREVIEDVLGGRDVLCVMPTGAGKSLCYQLPAAVQGGLALVVSPLISLMENQVQQLRDEGISCAMLSSGMSGTELRETMQQIEEGFSGLLYVAPERFNNPRFRDLMPRLRPNLLAIDEAHCISQWGHDFRPEYQQLGQVREALGGPPTIALTATATQEVREDIARSLGLRDPSIVVTGFDRPNLRYEARRIRGKKYKQEQLLAILDHDEGSGIVYCATRKAVDEVAGVVAQHLPARPVFSYHAGMDSGARTENQERFMRTPRAIAIATNAFGMGINKPDLRFVVHYNLPGNLEAYYQEAGRAGRDGQPARCILLFSYEDRYTQEFFIGRIGEDDQGNVYGDPAVIAELKRREQEKLERIISYASTWRCRRQQILDYFGDQQRLEQGKCRCDVCRDPAAAEADDAESLPQVDEATATLIRQMLSAVARLNGRVGVGTVAEVLGGSESEKVRRWGFDRLTVYGLLRTKTVKQVIAMLHRMIESGLVQQVPLEGDKRIPVVKLTAAGVNVMKGQAPPPAPLADLVPQRGASSYGTSARAGGGRRGGGRGDVDEMPLDRAATDRFNRLREVRAELARERDLPAYCICHDQTLRAIAAAAPAGERELAAIRGMGPRKVAMYGQALLGALRGAGSPLTGHPTAAREPRFVPDAASEWPSDF
jgi:ATP-dependent DNA helicase RecQ